MPSVQLSESEDLHSYCNRNSLRVKRTEINQNNQCLNKTVSKIKWLYYQGKERESFEPNDGMRNLFGCLASPKI